MLAGLAAVERRAKREGNGEAGAAASLVARLIRAVDTDPAKAKECEALRKAQRKELLAVLKGKDPLTAGSSNVTIDKPNTDDNENDNNNNNNDDGKNNNNNNMNNDDGKNNNNNINKV
jgi:hypothetical protein